MTINVQKQDAAISAGKTVANNLIGYTSDKEQKQVIDLVKQIDAEDVKSFLCGYKKAQTSPANIATKLVSLSEPGKYRYYALLGRNIDFFTQLNREGDFPEKNAIAKDVAAKLAEYLTSVGRTEEAEQLKTLLEREKMYPEKMDEIANKVIDYNF